MTNAQIIFDESMKLMKSGIIRGTGNFIKAVVTDQDGNEGEGNKIFRSDKAVFPP